MVELSLSDIAAGIGRNTAGTTALAERVDYLNVAVMRGDPRFSRDEYAKADFDCDAFDQWWRSKGKRVPSMEEVFGRA